MAPTTVAESGPDVDRLARYIAQRLDERYASSGLSQADHIPRARRGAHWRLLEAAFGPSQKQRFSITRTVTTPERREMRRHGLVGGDDGLMAEALIKRIGSPVLVVFDDMPLPHSVARSAVCCMKEGPVVRVIYDFDMVNHIFLLRADVSVTMIAAKS